MLASATVCCSLAAEATAATGGVITFTGALVAPSFDVSVGSAPGSHAPFAAQTQITDTRGRTTYVTFVPEPNNPPNAEVSLSVAGHATGADALAADFTDGKGHIVRPDARGTYHVGALGGTLSMRANDDAPASPKQVTLMTNYR
ncbi:hypothetical protein [Caballeronia ptereochthonis]|uniref:Lipoprotein n=1 Tax=Caballeronia ptereochthonis TaxID=1777144 RepID=A0A158AMJ1_9BURK|nr:hypothetical protein [Caballeronia ptereochthonis]SAK58963.1 hypothetical protein AWB83_02030 [Caballeronia ptereochthonis]